MNHRARLDPSFYRGTLFDLALRTRRLLPSLFDREGARAPVVLILRVL